MLEAVYRLALLLKLVHTIINITVQINYMHIIYDTSGYCASPDTGLNVSVKGYSNGVEGSQITYYCLPGLIPNEEMVASCTRDGNWIPNPSELVCRLKGITCA